MPKAKTTVTTTTYYVRGFPRALARQVASLATLRGLTVGEMLAIVVTAGLPCVQPVELQNKQALRNLKAVRRAMRTLGARP